MWAIGLVPIFDAIAEAVHVRQQKSVNASCSPVGANRAEQWLGQILESPSHVMIVLEALTNYPGSSASVTVSALVLFHTRVPTHGDMTDDLPAATDLQIG